MLFVIEVKKSIIPLQSFCQFHREFSQHGVNELRESYMICAVRTWLQWTHIDFAITVQL